jgi:undecaprenyl-diphosphatase
MNYFDAIIYGAVQGLTEYLPISSSAHLILLPRVLGHEDPGLAFDVFLHFGTLFATLFYFWREWASIALTLPGMGFMKTAKFQPVPTVSWKLIVVATFPALLAGALLHDLAETVFRSPVVLVVTLALGGVLLVLVDRFCRSTKTTEQAGWKDALGVGLAQCLALVPGMSRSGITITGARFLGFDRAEAARFSFLISAPVTGAAAVFELRKWHEVFVPGTDYLMVFVACFSAFVFGALAIGMLLRLLRRFGFMSFAVYRVLLAVVIFASLL